MNLEEITRLTALSPSHLIDLEEKLFPLDVSPPPVRWAFRGQPMTFASLAPSFQRVFGGNKSVGTAHLIEEKLTEAFRSHYMNLEERTPNMPPPLAIGGTFDLRCLSVMQHYGVPTRLLDWTSNFWTAIYFACAGDPDTDAELWYYDRSIFNDQGQWLRGLESLKIMQPPVPPEPFVLRLRDTNLVFELDPQLTPRMKTQMAHHTVSTEMFADHAQLIFDLFKSRAPDESVTGLNRIIIAKGCKEKTLKFLDEQNITASSIFPDVEGLGRFLRWQLESLLTTLL
jgi:hypothetical protein